MQSRIKDIVGTLGHGRRNRKRDIKHIALKGYA